MTSPEATPRTIAALTPDWLTRALRSSGRLTHATITAVESHAIGAEVGFLDGLARLTLTYDRPEAGAPASVVVKLPAVDALYRRIGNFYHAYEREIRFYDEVAPHSPIRLPRCYYREMDRDADTYLLILEDLSALSAGDQVKGMTPADVEAAVATLGAFQARWWDTPELHALDWMPRRNIQPARYHAAWPRFREVVGPHLPPAAIALGERLGVHLESLLAEIERQPQTIVHSDFRADNLLFDTLSCPQPVVILDWQLAIRGMGALDVARLLCGSVSSLARAACEKATLARWHDALTAGGVRDYSLQQAFDDYKKCALICLYYPVTIHEAEEAGGARGTALAHAQIERFFTAALDWKLASLLPD